MSLPPDIRFAKSLQIGEPIEGVESDKKVRVSIYVFSIHSMTGADPAGGGGLKLHKEGTNIVHVCACAQIDRILVLNSFADSHLSEILYPPLIQ